MYLSRLSLTNFRNLATLDLPLRPGVAVIFGGNAQGKTALLEGVYTLAIGRSFRAENEGEVVNFGTAAQLGQALVAGTIEKRDERLHVYVGYQCVAPTDTAVGSDEGLGYTVRKQIRVSRVRRSAAELVGLVNVVLFSAGDIGLVQGPPSGRRRYLDILISQSDSIYLRSLQRYQRVIQQRNHLLRMLREGRAEAVELAFWDEELVREGASLTWRRQEAMTLLSAWCRDHHRELAGDAEDLRLEYRPNVIPGVSMQETQNRFRHALSTLRHRERATATTAVGPHRDDFKLWVNEVDMGAFASRGQARTLALSLRLGEAAYLASVRREGPIVLLDDILSEMDTARRRRVLEKAAQYEQVLITTTDLELVQGFFGPKADYFQVSAGCVSPLGGQR